MIDEERNICLTFLNKLKSKGKTYHNFQQSLETLQTYVISQGLEDEDINLLATVIRNTDIGANKLTSLVKCLIPRYKVPEATFKLITTWCLSSVDNLPISLSIIIIQWIIGILNYQLIDKKVVNIYYSVFFYLMLKKEKLDKHIARLIYILTKPEDVTRRDVSRLLVLREKYKSPQGHIIALLSLFKTYKPELVPEKVKNVNIESVWKPMPETLQTMLQSVRKRTEYNEREDAHFKSFDWNKFERIKRDKMTPLVPSVKLLQIGSNIFKAEDVKSIFDITSLEDLGTTHFNMELPSTAISLLANTVGYHLLTFADTYYQSRFSYNLYNTLTRALILENEKFSEEEINKLLDAIAEFSRYMQQGIPAVNRFLNEYLYFNTGEYRSKLLILLQWTSGSITDLQEKVLVHVQNMYYESSLTEKCEIIRTFKTLITNLVHQTVNYHITFITEGFEECYQEAPSPFLGQISMNNLKDFTLILTKFFQDLIVSGLNIHSYNTLLLSEALLFYTQISILESRSTIQSFTIAPPAVIYGGFVTKSCAILSMTCNLLLRYRHISLQYIKEKPEIMKESIKILSVYVKDIFGALWQNKLSTKRKKYFLKNLPDNVLNDLKHCSTDNHLNILHHYAFLPYKCVLSKTGLDICTQQDAMDVALEYFPIVNEFLTIFQT